MLRKALIIIIIVIVCICLISLSFKLGYINGKVKEKEEKEYIIKDNTIKESSNDLRKKGYSLILEAQEIEEKIEQIPGTRLDVELGSLSKNSIILNYLSNNEEYGVYLKLNYYYFLPYNFLYLNILV